MNHRHPVQRKTAPAYRQQGMTLIMSLLFLLLLTILGVTAMNTSGLQEKMAGNLRDQDTALQAAESALRGGEEQLSTLWIGGKPNSDTTCSTGICTLNTTDPLNDAWWNTYSNEYGGGGNQIAVTGGAAADPRFVVEDYMEGEKSLVTGSYGKNPPVSLYYRITSRASGTTTLSQVVIEETYRIRYAP